MLSTLGDGAVDCRLPAHLGAKTSKLGHTGEALVVALQANEIIRRPSRFLVMAVRTNGWGAAATHGAGRMNADLS